MNKDGKIKGKFNIIDVLAIILVIVAVAGIVIRFGSKITDSVKSDATFVYTVNVSGVRDYTIDALQKKGKVTNKKSNMDVGEIIDVVVEPSETQSERADGKLVYSELPDRYDATITIKARGQEAANSYITADSEDLSVGRVIDIYTKYVHTSGKVMSVTKE